MRIDPHLTTSRRALRLPGPALAVAVLLAATAGVRAIEKMPLPAFALTTPEGTVVQSRSDLPAMGKWLMVYLEPDCRPCDRLLNLIKADQHPNLPSRIVIVMGRASDAAAAAARARRQDLTGTQWFTDRSHTAWSALRMTGVPIVFGIRDQSIEWTLSGVARPDEEIQSILASWAKE